MAIAFVVPIEPNPEITDLRWFCPNGHFVYTGLMLSDVLQTHTGPFKIEPGNFIDLEFALGDPKVVVRGSGANVTPSCLICGSVMRVRVNHENGCNCDKCLHFSRCTVLSKSSLDVPNIEKKTAYSEETLEEKIEFLLEVEPDDEIMFSEPDMQTPNYRKIAFFRPSNLVALLAVLGTGVALGSIPLLILGVCAEALWVIHAPDSVRLRAKVFDPPIKAKLRREAIASRWQRVQSLRKEDQKRFLGRTDRLRTVIREVKATNPEVMTLLANESKKIDSLIDLLLTTLVRAQSLRKASSNAANKKAVEDKLAELKPASGLLSEKDMARNRTIEILQQRLAGYAASEELLRTSEAQITLMENALDLICERISTLQPLEDVGSEIDDLIGSITATNTALSETESLLRRRMNVKKVAA